MALGLALAISPDVRAVKVRPSDLKLDDRTRSWPGAGGRAGTRGGRASPRLVTLRSGYRQVVDPLSGYVRRVAREAAGQGGGAHPGAGERRWYHLLLHSHTATALKTLLYEVPMMWVPPRFTHRAAQGDFMVVDGG